MTFDEFRRLAETFGADVERWPEPHSSAARALARSAEAAAVLDAERRLDVAFEAAPAVSRARADDAAYAVMQRLAAGPPARTTIWSQRRRWLVPATSLAGSALVGILLAASVPYAMPHSAAVTLLALTVDSGTIPTEWGLP